MGKISNLKRKRVHGFRKRSKLVIMRRIRKGRKLISVKVQHE
ncbi:MAG TPA: 50S ribosomal protein L34 [Mycoplasmatales bacterium]|jgi:ribosomal protein L34|nr:50S ribosomal protein L34 [Mycoplasmatales bacterium]